MFKKTVIVTGARGFIGRNLVQHLKQLNEIELLEYDIEDKFDSIKSGLYRADFVFHLAGINRPKVKTEFEKGNRVFTEKVIEVLKEYRRNIPMLMTSSTQAEFDNPYGISKRHAEEVVFNWAQETDGKALIYRLPNVFGKWCKPNYNSVVATFCYNIAHDMPIRIDDPKRGMKLVYIDDVVEEFLRALNGHPTRCDDRYFKVPRIFYLTLEVLANKLRLFRESRKTMLLPNFEDEVTRFLYATYVSYLPEDQFSFPLEMRHDQRGWLAEILKSRQFGQIFISRTKPGITRGNHWHHTKVEKFVVIQGRAVIRFRQINGDQIIDVPISGDEIKVVDVPPGYTHSITNVCDMDVITLFWADELFNPEQPDTYYLEV